MSSPSISQRILKLKDAGAILGFSVVINPEVFGLDISAYVRMHAIPGAAKRLEQMLKDTPQIVEADHLTGEDCFLAKVVVRDREELEAVIGRFRPFASTDAAIILSSIVAPRLPKL